MGFLVTASISTDRHTLDSFYVRIETYRIDKPYGVIYSQIAHYTDSGSANKAIPSYVEDLPQNDASGMVGLNFTYNSSSYDWPYAHHFHLTQSEDVNVTVFSSSFETRDVEYIDYDDDGNEIVATRQEQIEVVNTSSQVVQKSKVNLDLLSGSIYDHAYRELKEKYKSTFGSSNVNDLV